MKGVPPPPPFFFFFLSLALSLLQEWSRRDKEEGEKGERKNMGKTTSRIRREKRKGREDRGTEERLGERER